MREKIKTFFCALFLLVTLPYIITIVLQGKDNIEIEKTISASTDLKTEEVNVEEQLIGIVAGEMPITYNIESLKAQVVIARTNLMAAIKNGEEAPKSVSREELQKLWGAEGTDRNYKRLSDAIKATKGVVMTYQGEYIYAAFHAVSAGRTRSAKDALGSDKMPWLVSAESQMDIPSKDYLMVQFLEKKELVRMIKETFTEVVLDEENPLNSIIIEARDEGDYVMQIKVGEKIISGEEFRNALKINSACFYLKEVDGKIRIVTKGLGHGLGLSQYGANELAKQGKTYTDILSYYFKNIEISD